MKRKSNNIKIDGAPCTDEQWEKWEKFRYALTPEFQIQKAKELCNKFLTYLDLPTEDKDLHDWLLLNANSKTYYKVKNEIKTNYHLKDLTIKKNEKKNVIRYKKILIKKIEAARIGRLINKCYSEIKEILNNQNLQSNFNLKATISNAYFLGTHLLSLEAIVWDKVRFSRRKKGDNLESKLADITKHYCNIHYENKLTIRADDVWNFIENNQDKTGVTITRAYLKYGNRRPITLQTFAKIIRPTLKIMKNNNI